MLGKSNHECGLKGIPRVLFKHIKNQNFPCAAKQGPKARESRILQYGWGPNFAIACLFAIAETIGLAAIACLFAIAETIGLAAKSATVAAMTIIVKIPLLFKFIAI